MLFLDNDASSKAPDLYVFEIEIILNAEIIKRAMPPPFPVFLSHNGKDVIGGGFFQTHSFQLC